MARTDVAAAVNASVVPVVEYGPDPHGRARFGSLMDAVSRSVNPGAQRVFVVAPTWNGDTVNPQRYTGQASLGRARVVSARSSTIGQEREATPTNAAAMAIFAERIKKGR
ncbi:MAG: hypothetical protein FWF90_17370 [Promicromonosporaceae bacterium]|nr:hypothetical protein [Promicromonosporaceae bacterium]